MNHFACLQRNDGEMVDNQVDMCEVAESYFDELF